MSKIREFVKTYLYYILIAAFITLFVIKSLAAKDFGGDFIAYFLPHYHFIISQIRENHELPLWYPYAYNGLPELFKSELAVFHPVTLIIIGLNVLINKNLSLNITGNIIEAVWFAFLIFGSFGMFKLCKTVYKTSNISAFIASLIFVLNPLMLPTMNTNVFLGITILPWLMYFLARFASQFKLKYFLGIVIFNYLLFASGYPYFYVYFFLAQLGYIAFCGFKKTFYFIVGFGISTLLAGYFLLPGIYIYGQSVRDSSQSDSDFQLFTSNIPTRMVNILNPMPYGSSYSAKDPASVFTSNGVSWGTFLLPFLLFGIFSIKKSKKEVWLVMAFILAMVYSFGGYMDSQKFFGILIPVINKFRSHSIGLVITMFAGSVLIALGVDSAIRRKKNIYIEGAFWLLFLMLFFAMSLVPVFCPSCTDKYLDQILSLARTCFLLFSALVVYRLTINTKSKYFLYMGIFIFMLELHFYFQHLNGHFMDTTYKNFYQQNSLVPDFKDDKDLYRVYFDNDQFSYNTSNVKRFSYAGYETVPYKGWYKIQDKYGFNKTLDISNVKYFITTNPTWNLQNPDAAIVKDTGPAERPDETFMSSVPGLPYISAKSQNVHYIYKLNHYLPRFYVPHEIVKCQSSCKDNENIPEVVSINTLKENYMNPKPEDVKINIISYKPNSIEMDIDAPQAAFIASSEVWDQGWRLKVNNKDEALFKVSDTFRGFWVIGGKSKIVMKYTPPMFYYGLFASIFGAVLLLFIYSFKTIIFKEAINEKHN